jgi:hypothetical protein
MPSPSTQGRVSHAWMVLRRPRIVHRFSFIKPSYLSSSAAMLSATWATARLPASADARDGSP